MSRVLLLDDEPLMLLMYEDWFAELGYQMIGPAQTIRQALALVDSSPPDAAIIDVSIGGSESYGVADVLRARRIPFAFATGHDAKRLRHDYRGGPLLLKPFAFEKFKSVLGSLLAN